MAWQVDFVDINSGCPIDGVCNKGGGCQLMENRHGRHGASWLVGAACGPTAQSQRIEAPLPQSHAVGRRALGCVHAGCSRSSRACRRCLTVRSPSRFVYPEPPTHAPAHALWLQIGAVERIQRLSCERSTPRCNMAVADRAKRVESCCALAHPEAVAVGCSGSDSARPHTQPAVPLISV